MSKPQLALKLCLAALLTSLFLTPVAAEEQKGEILRNEFLGLELEVDPGWYNATEPGTTDTVLLSSRETDDKAYLLISRLPGLGRTLESFDTTTQNYIYTRMHGFLDEEKHVEVANRSGYLWVYQGESGVDRNGWRQFYRVICEKDGDFIVFQGVIDQTNFSKYRGMLENMIKSATWISD